MLRLIKVALVTWLVTLLAGCGYNQIQRLDERVKASWAEVLNQYQRRADLIPQLVSSVNAYMVHEREVLTEVTEARSRVGSLQLSPDRLPSEEEMRQFQAAQGQMTSALSRLLVVSENYPQLKADGLFRDLNVQLEGTENRLATARSRYNEAVLEYNVFIREFPTVITAKILGYDRATHFSVENEQSLMTAPVLQFDHGSTREPAAVTP